jgi:MazG family protein
MRSFLVEETYEVLEAISEGDSKALREELGDLLFNVLLVGQIAAEQDGFTIDDVAADISEKLVRRHPHVFGNETVDSEDGATDKIVKRWDELKRLERPERLFMESIPKGLPALLRAKRLTDRAARVGFEWPDIAGVWDKIEEEGQELREAIEEGTPDDIADEYGDVLFAWVNLGRFLGVDPEDALHATSRRFTERFNFIETTLRARGRTLEQSSLEEMDGIWGEAKVALHKSVSS